MSAFWAGLTTFLDSGRWLSLLFLLAGLIALKKRNPSLWNGQYGGDIDLLDSGTDKVFAFQRRLGANVVTVAVNLSDTAQRIMLPGRKADLSIPAWDWYIAEENK